MDNERLIEIETKLAFQEDTVQALNDALCQQQKQIGQLEAKVKILSEKIGELSVDASGQSNKQEIPPHY